MIKSIDNNRAPRVSVQYARKFDLFFEASDGNTVAYITSKTSIDTILECQRVAGPSTVVEKISGDAFTDKVNRYYESTTSDAKLVSDQIKIEAGESIETVVQSTQDLLAQSDESAPVVRLINAVLIDAIKQRASDVHIETHNDYFCVRYRIDGVLQDVTQPNKTLANALLSRVKVMAGMDIADKRTPQDGAIAVVLAHREVDIRVSTLPTRHGERLVMRLLTKNTDSMRLDSLGLNQEQHQIISSFLKKPQGLVLITGPTGSGKSTTLYAGIKHLDISGKNVLTVEDPIEYELPGVGQTQVNTKAGITFSATLKAMLRQDPDIVMVGEIRDEETARTAIQASLTGHLVLSTLHTNSAIGAVTRLIDMGIPPYLLATTLEGVVSQRLLRVLCPHCREAKIPSSDERAQIGESITRIYVPEGCPKCQQKGYSGRTGIYEILSMTPTTRALIHQGASEIELEKHFGAGKNTLSHDGFQKAAAGITTLEEVIRVAYV